MEALGTAPQTAYAVSLHMFGTSLDHFGRWMAMGETLSHLEHLVHEGEVVKVDDGNYVHYLQA
jgi:hypothetical protein